MTEVDTIYRIKTKVQKVYYHPSANWYIQFEGSSESICFGPEKPIWAVGTSVEITFRRIDAQYS